MEETENFLKKKKYLPNKDVLKMWREHINFYIKYFNPVGHIFCSGVRGVRIVNAIFFRKITRSESIAAAGYNYPSGLPRYADLENCFEHK